ncbi:AraC family transcriptional regulator [Paenibacillus nanensis]|uniref:AraC family transcriptional regulator n=1 Tax=Paenibacillus nanensis TaxID=393251 RepID=A0A3A1US87_9BACL|nr:AraC family transcriptional regulator [Paenibacillus nanensis]RIX50271.1 AraC family transcriptional regulator [Paenibacillus nanensis]
MIIQLSTPRLELWRIDGQFSNQPHVHDHDFQITIPLYGQCEFTLENRPYSLMNGGGLVQHPKEKHYFEIDASSGVLIFKLNQNGLRHHSLQEHTEFAISQQFDVSFMTEKFRKWSSVLLSCDPSDLLVQEELESEILYFLLDKMDGSHKHIAESFALRVPCADLHMSNALDYIHAYYKTDVRIDTLAALAIRSRYHFIRSFKELTGLTPYQYVLQLRIEEAKRLLKATKLTVTEISFSLGFSSVSQFQRLFAKASGATPSDFRRACR